MFEAGEGRGGMMEQRISGNKKTIYVSGLVKTMTCKIINKLVWW
jgi:hypothetical protein